ncbi:MAG: anthranilate synthase component I family protein [Bacteroidota bacterium]|nr:anthranilate synthase component I family protein [Bacteroidota bacterium]
MTLPELLHALRCTVTVRDIGSCTAEEFALHAAREAGPSPHVILLSGGTHECSTRSLAMLDPAAVLRVKNGRATLETADGTHDEQADPFDLLAAARAGLTASPRTALPAAVGGYVAYDAARAIEVLPARARDELGLPDLLLLWPTRILHHEHRGGRLRECHVQWRDGERLLNVIAARDHPSQTEHTDRETGHDSGRVRRSFSREAYEAAVSRVRDHIYEGDVYQVNLSQRFTFPLREAPAALWRKLYAANPAPFYAYVDGGDHQVLSTSMERLLRIEPASGGDHIETRPIKGTRPRGATAWEDAAFEAELRTSAKDDAELSMIVDLARNDLGRVCRTGTVRVAEHRRVERYANVMHLVSVVTGRLRTDAGIAEVFRALFPGGSITGCPKIRAMEIIDATEPVTRHAYTGSIGVLDADGTTDFNIAIRTAVVRDGLCHLSVGGGIVYDSDPEAEYMETLHKGGTFFHCADIDPHTVTED